MTVPVGAAVAKGAQLGDHSALLRVSSGGVELAHGVLYVFVRAWVRVW